MKNYYYNQKTQDLLIFDTEGNEILVLERLTGIRVFTSSEMREPGGDEPVKKWANSSYDPKSGKAGYKGERLKKAAKLAKKGGQWKCKNCGELGHSAKTCKNPAVIPEAARNAEELPDKEIDKVALEERAADPIEV